MRQRVVIEYDQAHLETRFLWRWWRNESCPIDLSYMNPREGGNILASGAFYNLSRSVFLGKLTREWEARER